MGTPFDYTPDFALIDWHDHLVCGECKSQCFADEPDIQAKHAAVKLWLAQVGIRFVVVTDNDLACEVSRLNSRDLVRGIRTLITASAKATLNRRISEIQPMAFGELADLVGHDYALVALARGMSYFDTHQRLTRTTALQPFQENFDAANFIYRKSTN
ncbi:hypothetical protein [Rhodoferax sp. BLA1]|uniref:hypothetical protein n=1 Tax=Rhodoferax sp. BLA1 TaxID=2576062 RepID=UPI0015D2C08E|nr:hypothetical protein [Rhodoferax sp. BLA1]